MNAKVIAGIGIMGVSVIAAVFLYAYYDFVTVNGLWAGHTWVRLLPLLSGLIAFAGMVLGFVVALGGRQAKTSPESA